MLHSTIYAQLVNIFTYIEDIKLKFILFYKYLLE